MFKKLSSKVNKINNSSIKSLSTKAQEYSQKVDTITKVAEEPSPYFQINNAPYSSELEIRDTKKIQPNTVFRCLNLDGTPVDPKFIPPVSDDEMIKMYETMVLQRSFDDIFYKLARMNLISFYMPNNGEEVCQIGTIAAMNSNDYIFSQYRELGAFLYRGMSLQECADLNFSNNRDINCGRQMPVHYGSTKLNMITISSTLSTQMPQASGASYGIKRTNNEKEFKDKSCVLCYFGEGAASEGDAMVAFNFSATLNTPTLWLCRNNAYAISTPTSDQYCGDGIVARAYGYGMYGCRFDGNDIFATYIATKECRDISVSESRPFILEAMTYRASHHSTSDDSKTYRAENEEHDWNVKYNPIIRTRNYLEYIGLWNSKKELDLIEKVEEQVTNAKEKAEDCYKPHWKHLYTDVYDEIPQRLKNQMNDMEEHLKKYGNEEYYKLHQHSLNEDRQCPPK